MENRGRRACSCSCNDEEMNRLGEEIYQAYKEIIHGFYLHTIIVIVRTG